MSAAAVLLLLPHVLLLPPEAPADLAPLAASCVSAVQESSALRVTAVTPDTTPGGSVADRVRPTLDGAAAAYRAMRLQDARSQALEVITALEADAQTSADFELLLQSRLRLAATLLAQRRQDSAREVLEVAARQAPDARVTDRDWPPNLVEAWDTARARVTGAAASPPLVTIQTAITGVPARLFIDGRAVGESAPSLPPGDHVFVATAPGHGTVRQVVRLPVAGPWSIALPALVDAMGAIVLGFDLARAGAGQVKITLRRAGGGDATREVSEAEAPRVTRSLAETLAGTAGAVAEAGAAASDPPPGAERIHAEEIPSEQSGTSRSILTRWWFWTIVGGVATLGVIAGIAASRQDPGTDVHVGF